MKPDQSYKVSYLPPDFLPLPCLPQVIAGWERGVLGMREGGKRRLTLAPNMAYGTRGAPPDIPGNATLVGWRNKLVSDPISSSASMPTFSSTVFMSNPELFQVFDIECKYVKLHASQEKL